MGLYVNYLQFHARNDLLIREDGSFAVAADVRFFFMPSILAQNEARRPASALV